MKDLSWIKYESDENRRDLINKSPWFTMQPGTEIYVNYQYSRSCCVIINGRTFTSERIGISEKRIFEGVTGFQNTNPFNFYRMSIKEYLETHCPNIELYDFIFTDSLENRQAFGLSLSYNEGENQVYKEYGFNPFEDKKTGKKYDAVMIHLQWMLDYHELSYCRQLFVNPFWGKGGGTTFLSFYPRNKMYKEKLDYFENFNI